MYERQIPYHYEEKLQLGNRVVVPDFKILVYSEDRFKYLEHCGRMGEERYRQNFAWKIQCYLRLPRGGEGIFVASITVVAYGVGI